MDLDRDLRPTPFLVLVEVADGIAEVTEMPLSGVRSVILDWDALDRLDGSYTADDLQRKIDEIAPWRGLPSVDTAILHLEEIRDDLS